MSTIHTGSPILLLPLVGVLQLRGVNVLPLLDRHGLSLAGLSDFDSRVDHETIMALWEEAPRLAGEPNLGILAGRLYRPGTFHVLDYVCMSAPTNRISIERGTRYLRIMHDLAIVELREKEGSVVHRTSTGEHLPSALSEFLMGAQVVCAQLVSGIDKIPITIHFAHSAPENSSVAEEFFGCPVHYDHPENEIFFDPSILDRATVTSDSVLADVVLGRAETMVSELPEADGIIPRLRSQVSQAMADGPTLDSSAAELRMSPRTLRRRLSEENTSFKQELDSVREKMATRLLNDRRVSIEDAAFLLGFSDSSSFHRAFRRWTGAAPTAYRRDRLQAD